MARLRASWRTSLPVVQQPRNPQSESIARTPYDPVRAAGLARTPLARDDAALRPDHAEHADQGLHRCRLLRPQRAHHRGADRPRGGAERRGGCGRALAALRPWPRLLQLHVLRAVPPPDGLRTLRLLHSQAKRQGAAARSQGGRGPQAGADPAHRWRARSRRAGSAGRGQAARRPGEYADPGRPNAPRTCGAPVPFALSAIFHIIREWFADAFPRYLPELSVTPSHSHGFNDLAERQSVTRGNGV